MIHTPKHLSFVLREKYEELENLVVNINDSYREKIEIKHDKNGNPKVKNGIVQTRVLNPSKGKLKLIQKRIHTNILRKLKLPDYAYGGVRRRDNVTNAKRHQGKKFVFTTDLRSFYPSITHHQVFRMFRAFEFSPTIARLLTQLTTYKGALPQGTHTSPLIANLVFVRTGKKLEQFAKDNNITFTSFVDDLTFSCPSDFKSKAPYIIDVLQQDGFRISHDKTNYKTRKPIVTGLVVKNNHTDLTDSFKIKLVNIDGKSPAQIKGLNLYAEKVKRTNSKRARK